MVRVEGRYRSVGLVFGLLLAAGCGDSERNQSSSGRNGGASGSGGSAGASSGTSSGGGSSGTGGTPGGNGGSSGGTAGSSSGTGGSQAGSGGNGGGDTPEGFRAAFIEAACENLFTCGWGSDGLTMRALMRTRERCVELYDARFGPHIELRLDAVARGILTFDAAEARHCLDVVPRACVLWETEEPLDAFRVTCGGVFEGTVAVGGDCASDEDCAGDAVCSRDTTNPTCLGFCAPKVPAGTACADEIPCSTGGLEHATCGSDSACATVALGAPVPEGAACGLMPAGEHALTMIPCASGTWCNRGSEPMGVCAQPLAAGEECPTEQAPCRDGALCVSDGPVDRCIALAIQMTAGTPCRAAEHEFCDPYAGLVCTADVCEDAPGDCVQGFSCPADRYCAASECTPKKGLGEECAVHDECASALCVQRLVNEPHRCYAPFCADW